MIISYFLSLCIAILGGSSFLVYSPMVASVIFSISLFHAIVVGMYLYNTKAIMKWHGIDGLKFQRVMTREAVDSVGFTTEKSISCQHITNVTAIMESMKNTSHTLHKLAIYSCVLMVWMLIVVYNSPLLVLGLVSLMVARQGNTRYQVKWKKGYSEEDKTSLLRGSGTSMTGIAITKVNL